jgi:hypothetical protein
MKYIIGTLNEEKYIILVDNLYTIVAMHEVNRYVINFLAIR